MCHVRLADKRPPHGLVSFASSASASARKAFSSSTCCDVNLACFCHATAIVRVGIVGILGNGLALPLYLLTELVCLALFRRRRQFAEVHGYFKRCRLVFFVNGWIAWQVAVEADFGQPPADGPQVPDMQCLRVDADRDQPCAVGGEAARQPARLL